ncbi:hypothetical protein [Clostridium lundense]|uniref:hypothetical protein n=1 Tax=Clostridium lundense TaxID=319475 RepID=UPI000685EB5F|nr:hypothetical protein [Clostridium lundense]
MERQIYGPLELPSGKVIRFRAPIGSDRMNVIQMMKIDEEAIVSGALLIDDYVKAKCVVEIDSSSTDGNYKELFNEWLDTDVNFYKLVFNKMFGNTKDLEKKADDAVAFLLGKPISSDGHSAQNLQASLTVNG